MSSKSKEARDRDARKARERQDRKLLVVLAQVRQAVGDADGFDVVDDGWYHAMVQPSGPRVSRQFLFACVYRGFLRAGDIDGAVRRYEFLD